MYKFIQYIYGLLESIILISWEFGLPLGIVRGGFPVPPMNSMEKGVLGCLPHKKLSRKPRNTQIFGGRLEKPPRTRFVRPGMTRSAFFGQSRRVREMEINTSTKTFGENPCNFLLTWSFFVVFSPKT